MLLVESLFIFAENTGIQFPLKDAGLVQVMLRSGEWEIYLRQKHIIRTRSTQESLAFKNSISWNETNYVYFINLYWKQRFKENIVYLVATEREKNRQTDRQTDPMNGIRNQIIRERICTNCHNIYILIFIVTVIFKNLMASQKKTSHCTLPGREIMRGSCLLSDQPTRKKTLFLKKNPKF